MKAAYAQSSYKPPVRAAATGDLTLSGLQTVDSVSLVAGDYVMAPLQTVASDRNVFRVAEGAWKVAREFSAEFIKDGIELIVQEGGQAGKQFFVTAASAQSGTLAFQETAATDLPDATETTPGIRKIKKYQRSGG